MKFLNANRARLRLPFVAFLFLAATFPLSGMQVDAKAPQAAGGVAAAESKFHVIRSISGSKGVAKAGEYTILDPRTVFYIPQDRTVIVYFEWDGPIGKHHFEALWKNPTGKVSAVSDFDYEAVNKRFGGYWSLALAEDAPTGMWSLEARVDGEVTGEHTFEVVAATRPDNLPTARPPASPNEIYDEARKSMVYVQKFGPAGEQLSSASGFFLGDGLIVTPFQAIDGATSLRIVLSDGKQIPVDHVVAWDRKADWTLLKVQGTGFGPLHRAKPASWTIGDECYAMNSTAQGSRTLASGAITGKSNATDSFERMNTSYLGQNTTGSPLLDKYGDVIGMMGGDAYAGATSRDIQLAGILPEAGAGTVAVPIEKVSIALGDKQASLAQMAEAGLFVLPITMGESVLYATFTKKYERSISGMLNSVYATNTFDRADAKVFLITSWAPQFKADKKKRTSASTTTLRIYDLVDNKLMGVTGPVKLQRNPNEASQTVAELAIARLPAGTYRIDQLLGDDVAWRGFFRINP
jgi:S1-C subfamily serine protease